MNKAANKLHEMFLKGKINGAVFEHMYKMASDIKDEDYAPLLLEHTKNIETLGVKSKEGCEQYFDVYTKCPKIIEKISGIVLSKNQIYKLCELAIATNTNQLDKLALDFIKQNDLIKNCYPNNMGIDGSGYVSPQYNIEKWIDTLRNIYASYHDRGLSMADTAKELTANWPTKERINFERWMKFYQEGDHLKYNVKTAMKKDAQQFQYIPRSTLNQVQNIISPPVEEEEDTKVEVSQAVKKKLRGRLMSMDKILYEYGDVFPETELKDLVSIIKSLDDKIRFLKLKASITNCLIRGANQLQKRGFVEGANELNKIAQEVEQNTLPETPEAPVAPVATKPQSENTEKAPEPSMPQVSMPNISAEGDKIDIPDFNSSTVKDALSKLEEVNKVISERNVVRALAAVDIILGQLGIASYFPKLSEAQSKLMDAFNYAGTRVAEVIGMMRGGQGVNVPQPQAPAAEETIEVNEELPNQPEPAPAEPAASPQQQPTPKNTNIVR